MKLFFLVSIFLQFEVLCQGNELLTNASENIDEEVLFIGDDKNDKLKELKKKLINLADKQSKEFTTNLSADIYQLSFFNLGLDIKTKTLKLEDSHHDASKILIIRDEEREGVPRWVRTTFAGKGVIPFSLHAGLSLFGNVGAKVWIEGRGEVKSSFELVNHSKAIESEDANFGEVIANKARDTWTGVKSIRFPMTGEKLLEKFPPGAEYSKEFFFSLLSNVGGAGGAYIQVEHKTYALTESFFRRTAKIHSVGGKKYIQLIFQNKNIKGRDSASGLTTGVTVFQGGPINLALNVNILSHHKAKKNTKNIIYDFFIDPDYPQAMQALKKAFHGNITHLQNLAVLRHEVDRFQGVTLNQSTNELLDEIIKDVSVGLFIDGTQLKTDYAAFKVQKKLGEFYKHQKVENNQTYSKEIKTFNGSLNRVVATPIKIEKKRVALWGIAGKKDKNVEVFNSILQTEQNIEGGEIRKVYVNKVKYRSILKSKYAKERILNKALSNMVQLAKFKGDQIYLDSLLEFEKRRCSRDLQIDRIGSFYFYNPGSGKQFQLTLGEYYAYMGKFIDDPDKASFWRYDKKRKERLEELKQSIQDKTLNKRHRDLLAAKLTFFKQMEKAKLPYYFTAEIDPAKLMKKFGDEKILEGIPASNRQLYLKIQAIFESSAGHPYFFDWLNFIYLEQLQKNDQRIDLYSRYQIKSKECKLNYTYLAPTRFSLQNISAELTR